MKSIARKLLVLALAFFTAISALHAGEGECLWYLNFTKAKLAFQFTGGNNIQLYWDGKWHKSPFNDANPAPIQYAESGSCLIPIEYLPAAVGSVADDVSLGVKVSSVNNDGTLTEMLCFQMGPYSSNAGYWAYQTFKAISNWWQNPSNAIFNGFTLTSTICDYAQKRYINESTILTGNMQAPGDYGFISLAGFPNDSNANKPAYIFSFMQLPSAVNFTVLSIENNIETIEFHCISNEEAGMSAFGLTNGQWSLNQRLSDIIVKGDPTEYVAGNTYTLHIDLQKIPYCPSGAYVNVFGDNTWCEPIGKPSNP